MGEAWCLLAFLIGFASSLERKTLGRQVTASRGNGYPLNAHASVEERVRILSHGLLLLGSGFKEQVERTKEQMGRIFRQLELFNSSVAELVGQVGACRSSGDSLSKRALELEQQEGELHRLATELQDRLRLAMEHGASFEGKLQALEERTETSLEVGAGGNLMALLRTQSRRIDELFAEVEIQHSEMSAQEAEIEYLIRRTGSRRRKSGTQRQN